MDLEEKVKIVVKQTNYTEDQAREKLMSHNMDEIKCIKEYLGIVDKPYQKKSLNQLIYKEIRSKLGSVELPSILN
jgi:hypothetical protein